MAYTVKWVIDSEAESPKAAAEEALAILQDPDSTAKVFTVTNTLTRGGFIIDLSEDD